MGDSRTADKFVVRLPDGMRNHLYDASAANHRSMNGEIVHRLEQCQAMGQDLATQKDLVRVLTARVIELESAEVRS